MRATKLRSCVALSAVLAICGCAAELHNSGDDTYSPSNPSRIPLSLYRGQSAGISRQQSVAQAHAAAVSSSSWEYGASARVAPGYPLGQTGLTIHPMGSYSYLKFDGGHDDRFELGGQVRRVLSPRKNGSGGVWIGGEAAGAVLRTSIDNFSSTQSTNGWSATALAGVPVGDSKWGVNLYGGAGVSYYGSSGVNLRAGFDLQPWFLKQ